MGPQDPTIAKILDFWFGLPTQEWFGDKHDEYITKNFAKLVDKARLTAELDEEWTRTPSGSLALILLLDQFTRNIFRPKSHPDPALSWSGDSKAHELALRAISKGWDIEIMKQNATHANRGYSHRTFFYLPLMHAEDMTSQIACCALSQNMAHELETAYGLTFAIRHRDCIAAFGRFPGRNESLGRSSTEEEKRFLESHPEGF
ncbi:hypothetical protein ANO11243_075250 [Dothideomycetidae sp. 11243]|nr:hypothetical protein ANO11243_075250 [fungal sp. No.11243]